MSGVLGQAWSDVDRAREPRRGGAVVDHNREDVAAYRDGSHPVHPDRCPSCDDAGAPSGIEGPSASEACRHLGACR